MKPKNLFILPLTLVLLTFTGCSPLTKTQTKAVNQYFQTIVNYSDYSIWLNKSAAKIKLDRLQLYPESYDTDTVMIEALVKSFETYQKEMKLTQGMDSALDQLNKYIKDYFLLTPNGFRILKLLSGGSSLIGSYFGLGNLINSAFNYGRETNLLPSNAKKVKKHIVNGQAVIDGSTEIIRNFAEGMLWKTLSQENIYIRENYRKFLDGLRDKPDSYDYYSMYNTIFIRHFEFIYNTRVLASQIIESTESITRAQRALIQETDKRHRLKSGVAEIQELYLQINQMKRTIQQLNMLLAGQHSFSQN